MSTLTIVRQIAARPEIVFDAMTTAEGLRRWFGPDEGPVLVSESDARSGGAYRIRFRMLDGEEVECYGTYLTFDPPHTFAMTFAWKEDDGKDLVTRIEASFRANEGGTQLTFVHAGLASDASRDRHVAGWNQCFEKLAAFCATSAARAVAAPAENVSLGA